MKQRIACLVLLTALAPVLTGCSRTVLVDSSPEHARVLVDGEDVGDTPRFIQLKWWSFRGEDLTLIHDQTGARREFTLRANRPYWPGLVGTVLTFGLLAPWAFTFPDRITVELPADGDGDR